MNAFAHVDTVKTAESKKAKVHLNSFERLSDGFCTLTGLTVSCRDVFGFARGHLLRDALCSDLRLWILISPPCV